MTNRKLGAIIRNQKPLILSHTATVQSACQEMSKRNVGCVLVVDDKKKLVGIFTGRDAVRTVGKSGNVSTIELNKVMTQRPLTVASHQRACDALQMMCDGGFRHLPVVEGENILGVVSRNDFKGMEVDQIDQCEHLAECIW
ncbi:MAG: cyclic nucleotide-binding/CBS domain-containing protein [Hyphomicrobium sp.]